MDQFSLRNRKCPAKNKHNDDEDEDLQYRPSKTGSSTSVDVADIFENRLNRHGVQKKKSRFRLKPMKRFVQLREWLMRLLAIVMLRYRQWRTWFEREMEIENTQENPMPRPPNIYFLWLDRLVRRYWVPMLKVQRFIMIVKPKAKNLRYTLMRRHWSEVRFFLLVMVFLCVGAWARSKYLAPPKHAFERQPTLVGGSGVSIGGDMIRFLEMPCIPVLQIDFDPRYDSQRIQTLNLLSLRLQESKEACLSAKSAGSDACLVLLSRGKDKMPLALYNPEITSADTKPLSVSREQSDFMPQCVLERSRAKLLNIDYDAAEPSEEVVLKHQPLLLKGVDAVCIQHALEVLNGTHVSMCKKANK
jgi:peptide deformylase